MIRRIAFAMLAIFAGLALQAPALAADLIVVVTDNNGRPVEDAVAILDAPGGGATARRFVINQKDEQFAPQVLVIPVGSTIEFGNLDPFRHHVYSFSPARKFELKLFGEGETRPVKFDKVGLVAIGCNIHDQMQGFIQVVDTPHAAKSGANGRIVLRNVPAGNFQLRVYHPRLRAPGNQLMLTVNTATSKTVPVEVRLRRSAPTHHDY
ncbi:MAG TPA: methylamine utilization protein [Sphingomonadaceae bacterium]|nr:methylamine utilization protein [Sphingomonadaceae bacterium]